MESKYSPRMFGRTGEDAWKDMAFPPDIVDPAALPQETIDLEHGGGVTGTRAVLNGGLLPGLLPPDNVPAAAPASAPDTFQGNEYQRYLKTQNEYLTKMGEVLNLHPPTTFNEPFPTMQGYPGATPLPNSWPETRNLLRLYPIASLLGGNRVANQLLPAALGGVQQRLDSDYALQERNRQAETERIFRENQYGANTWLQRQNNTMEQNRANQQYNALLVKQHDEQTQAAYNAMLGAQKALKDKVSAYMRNMSLASKMLMDPNATNEQVKSAANSVDDIRRSLMDLGFDNIESLADPADIASIQASRMSKTDLEKLKERGRTERTKYLVDQGYMNKLNLLRAENDFTKQRDLANFIRKQQFAEEQYTRDQHLLDMRLKSNQKIAGDRLDFERKKLEKVASKMGNIDAYREFLVADKQFQDTSDLIDQAWNNIDKELKNQVGGGRTYKSRQWIIDANLTTIAQQKELLEQYRQERDAKALAVKSSAEAQGINWDEEVSDSSSTGGGQPPAEGSGTTPPSTTKPAGSQGVESNKATRRSQNGERGTTLNKSAKGKSALPRVNSGQNRKGGMPPKLSQAVSTLPNYR